MGFTWCLLLIYSYRNGFHRKLIKNVIEIILIEILPIGITMLNLPEITTEEEFLVHLYKIAKLFEVNIVDFFLDE